MQVSFKTEVEAVSFLNTVLLNDRKATLSYPVKLNLTLGDVIAGRGGNSTYTVNFQPRKTIDNNGKKITVNANLKDSGILIPQSGKIA